MTAQIVKKYLDLTYPILLSEINHTEFGTLVKSNLTSKYYNNFWPKKLLTPKALETVKSAFKHDKFTWQLDLGDKSGIDNLNFLVASGYKSLDTEAWQVINTEERQLLSTDFSGITDINLGNYFKFETVLKEFFKHTHRPKYFLEVCKISLNNYSTGDLSSIIVMEKAGKIVAAMGFLYSPHKHFAHVHFILTLPSATETKDHLSLLKYAMQNSQKTIAKELLCITTFGSEYWSDLAALGFETTNIYAVLG